MTDKDKIIASIKQRILDEQRKHRTLDWALIASKKIYGTHIVKNLDICSVEGQSEQLFCFNRNHYTRITEGISYTRIDDDRVHCRKTHYMIKNDTDEIKCYLKSCFKEK